MTARDDILQAAAALCRRSGKDTFTLHDILVEMRRSGTSFADSTIRTHVSSRMCADSPDHHARTYDDFERVGHGVYRIRARR